MSEKLIKLSNSINMNTIITGQGKTTILLLHFSGGTNRMWNGMIPFLYEKYNIIAPDIRGHGKTDKPLSSYHIDEMAHDLYLLLKELEIPYCHIIGSSMGAEIGLSLAANYPEMVLSLICEGALYNEFGEYGLFKGSSEAIEDEKKNRKEEMQHRKPLIFTSKEEYIHHVTAYARQNNCWNNYFEQFFESTVQITDEGFYTNRYVNHVRSQYMINYWEIQFEEYYKKIQCPILFLPSEEERKDERIMNSLEYFKGLVKTYEVVNIDSSVHPYVWMQFPETASKIVDEFLEKNK